MDISSDDGSESADDDRPVVAMSGQSKQIAKHWLERVRGGAQARSRVQQRPEDISDEDSTEDGFDTTMQVGPKATVIAKIWLQKVRHILSTNSADQGPSISDDESTSDSDARNVGENRIIPLSGKTKVIALAWLRNIRAR